ncbi:hypothetical protein FKM82_023838 [Ascaphus truei]
MGTVRKYSKEPCPRRGILRCRLTLVHNQRNKPSGSGGLPRNGTEQTPRDRWIANPRHGAQETMFIRKSNRTEAFKRTQTTHK